MARAKVTTNLRKKLQQAEARAAAEYERGYAEGHKHALEILERNQGAVGVLMDALEEVRKTLFTHASMMRPAPPQKSLWERLFDR